MQFSAAATPPGDVAVVSDSSACLPPALLAQYGISIVPLALLVDGELHHDGEMTPAEFRERLESAAKPATTTAPAPGEFLHTFRALQEQGKRAILCLTLSSAYSGTHSAAVNAADMALREMPGLRIVVVDTGGLAMAHGFAVLAAGRAAAAGADVDAAAAAAKDVAGRSHLVGAIDSMRYLARSGRVPWIVHWAASVLQIKPVLLAHEGRVRSVGRPRTTRNALNRLVRYLETRAGPPEKLHVAVAHYDAPERAEELAEMVRERVEPGELIVSEFTPVMSVHTGPGFVGLAFYQDEPQHEAAAKKHSRRAEADARVLEEAVGRLPAPVQRPVFVMLSGLPGAGKSRLAAEIAARHPLAVVESDRLRKMLFERPVYTQRENQRLFAAVHALLDDLLGRGISCLLDATNLKEAHRRPVYEIAERRGARVLVAEVRAPRETAVARLRARHAADPSDADEGVYEQMAAEAEPIEREHVVVDGGGDAAGEAERVLREMGTEVGGRK